MSFHTEGQIIYAVNGARDLTEFVEMYLKLWRKLANGALGVTVPSDELYVRFQPLNNPDFVNVSVKFRIETEQRTPIHDPPSDYDSETMGSMLCRREPSHYHTSIDYYMDNGSYRIPMEDFFKTEEELKVKFQALADQDKKDKKEKEKQEEIKRLEERLANLKGQK